MTIDVPARPASATAMAAVRSHTLAYSGEANGRGLAMLDTVCID